jgi:hypothetical protein
MASVSGGRRTVILARGLALAAFPPGHEALDVVFVWRHGAVAGPYVGAGRVGEDIVRAEGGLEAR